MTLFSELLAASWAYGITVTVTAVVTCCWAIKYSNLQPCLVFADGYCFDKVNCLLKFNFESILLGSGRKIDVWQSWNIRQKLHVTIVVLKYFKKGEYWDPFRQVQAAWCWQCWWYCNINARKSFFTNCVVDIWNSRPAAVFKAPKDLSSLYQWWYTARQYSGNVGSYISRW